MTPPPSTARPPDLPAPASRKTGPNELGIILRAARTPALATLTRYLRNMDAAEDALQDAMARAILTWPAQGMPGNPTAWLIHAGKNCAIDAMRRRRLETRYLAQQWAAPAGDGGPADPDDAHLKDDMLRLIFTCCHPVLTEPSQIALTLKTVAGLSVEEIARSFLAAPKSMERRITRAKHKLGEAGMPYEVPAAGDLDERRRTVLKVVYLIFNEGYKSTGGPELLRPYLCGHAIRLGRLMSRLFRAEPEVTGLLALMLLHHARWRTRLGGNGEIVTLDRQDRANWDRPMIAEGLTLVEKALRRRAPGPYQVQAAIAAVHCRAADFAATDWPEIVRLYGVLEVYQPSPVITLNRAVALSQAEDSGAGLALLDTIAATPQMRDYPQFHGARAAMLEDLGKTEAAIAAFDRAKELAPTDSERAYFGQKRTALANPPGRPCRDSA